MDSDKNQALERVDHEFRKLLGSLSGGLAPQDYAAAATDWWLHFMSAPGKQAELQQAAFKSMLDLWDFSARAAQGQALSPTPEGEKDTRFTGSAWELFPFNVYARAHRLGSGLMQQAVTGVDGVQPRSQQLMEFVAQQAADASSPANFPGTNPEVIQKTVEEKGANLARGWQHFLEDLERTQNGGEAPGTEDFRVGEKLAITPGKVVYRNELIELIQYSPATDTVQAEPVLIVPAWIMKYYILDLSPRNSMVKWLVESGHTVFMISWKNPSAADRHLGMDDYLSKGIYAALDAVTDIVPECGVHAVGYCIGGTLLSIAAAALARRGDTRIQDVTLLAAQTDFSEPGELSLFISPSQLAMLETLMQKEGVLESSKMGGAFTLLRAHDLLWQPAVNAYLKGERAGMIDLMAWNADGTRMPARMHTEYLYGLYLNNDLALDRFTAEGEPVHLSDIRVPMFVVGTETDHVAPWKSVYKVDGLVRSDEVTFLLTSGGHNAGIVSGAVHPKRRHRVRTRAASDARLKADRWLDETEVTPGSWWPTWEAWLRRHGSSKQVAPPAMGSGNYPALEDAPGQYVRQR
ncbi:MAG: PHA/PHB synthase family protein [Steroidobacteraceae bacterium]